MEAHVSTTRADSQDRRGLPSPRLTERVLARHPAATRAPAPHTEAELDALLRLFRASSVQTITIGHGRHAASSAAAAAIAAAWTRPGDTVIDTVDWPAVAASWLRPARRLVATQPDAWVIVDNPAGAAQLLARLVAQPGWDPARTFATASIASTDLVALTGPGALTGVRGTTAGGRPWRFDHGLLIRDDTDATQA